MDISGIPPRLLLDYFPRLESVAHKTLWGTDWPGPMVPTLSGNLEVFRRLPLAQSVQRAILYRNAERLFGLGS
jgi:predicted TIM-barrel fold metal-dependent hydrolase